MARKHEDNARRPLALRRRNRCLRRDQEGHGLQVNRKKREGFAQGWQSLEVSAVGSGSMGTFG
jgi:hypothetical protein